jgi:hypothetical protein
MHFYFEYFESFHIQQNNEFFKLNNSLAKLSSIRLHEPSNNFSMLSPND